MKIQQLNDINKLDFEKSDGLIPAIIQNIKTGQVLMLGYMNKAAVKQTLDTGQAWFYSRSKNRLWKKGESSGNTLDVHEIRNDCDQDALLIAVTPNGPTCHTGQTSCFADNVHRFGFLRDLNEVISNRKHSPSEESYTSSLFTKGITRIAQKVGEEATETIIGALAESDESFLNESADLVYHLIVLLVEKGYSLDNVIDILEKRHRKKPS